MNINTIGLLFDAGLFVLIWMIQLVVYPSFKFYSKENLLKWHRLYTTQLSLIVIPLMFGQLIILIFQTTITFNYANAVSLILVSIIWFLTFLQFVPLHHKIAQNNIDKDTLKSLVSKNWLRTLLWSLVFIWNFYNYVVVTP